MDAHPPKTAETNNFHAWLMILRMAFAPHFSVKNRAGAPFGDALLAGVATGVFKDFSIARTWAQYVDPMEPDAATHELYQRYFQAYKRLYEHVKDDYKSLAALRSGKA